MADDPNTPDSYRGPVWLALVPSIVTVVHQAADASGDVRRIAESLGVAWALPHLAGVAAVLGLAGALVWLYRRAVGRGARWALWLRDRMPWA